jgi:hypothetical protein
MTIETGVSAVQSQRWDTIVIAQISGHSGGNEIDSFFHMAADPGQPQDT